MKEQRTRKETEIRRKKGMQRKKKKTKKEGDTTGLKTREDTRKVEKAILRSTKETKGRSIETESDTQTDTKKGRMTEKDERGIPKGGRTKVQSLPALICGVIISGWTNIPVFQIRAQRRTQEAERGEREKTQGQGSSRKRLLCTHCPFGFFRDWTLMSRRKSGSETETLPPRSVRVPTIRSGVTAATGSGRNETDTGRRGAMRRRKRKDVGTEAAQRKLQRKLRLVFA